MHARLRKAIQAAGIFLLPAIFAAALGAFFAATTAWVAEGGTTPTSKLQVTNVAPAVSAVLLNHGNAITLNANATASIDINYTLTDNNGCSDTSVALTTSTAFRDGATSVCAVPNPVANTLNCYLYVSHVTSSCSGSSVNVTDTVEIYYFAEATDSSSTYPSSSWYAYVIAADSSGATSTATSTGVALNTLLAIEITSSTINYGTLSVGTDTSSTNQIATVKNAGNSSTTLRVSGTALTRTTTTTLPIATSSQHYATSAFTYGNNEQPLQPTATDLSGFIIPRPPLDARWATTTPLPSAIYDHSAVVNNGFIYTTGGCNAGACTAVTSTVYFAPISSTNSVGAWATTTPLPTAIYQHSAVVNNGFIYTTGGFAGGAITSTVYFAPISSTNSVGAWATTTPLPTAIYQHSAVVNNGFIYATGGCTGSCADVTVTSTVYFAPISSTNSVGAWATTTPLPSVIRSHSAVVNNGFIYTTGGYTGAVTSTVYFISAASRNTYWGVSVSSTARNGVHNGQTTFTAVFSP